jgi:MFS family permease
VRRVSLAVIATAQFVLVLDITIVTIALPTIQRELGFEPEELQWLVTSYALTFGGFLLLAGRAADLFGRRRMFIGGILLFGLASLAAGLSPNELTLVCARASQGLAGAFVSPAALALLTTTLQEGRERNRALGIFGAVDRPVARAACFSEA